MRELLKNLRKSVRKELDENPLSGRFAERKLILDVFDRVLIRALDTEQCEHSERDAWLRVLDLLVDSIAERTGGREEALAIAIGDRISLTEAEREMLIKP